MKKKSREGGRGGQGGALTMVGALTGGSLRLATGIFITVAGSCLCFYGLLLILTSWNSLSLCKTPPSPYCITKNYKQQQQLRPPNYLGGTSATNPKAATNISHIVFGIAASSSLWERRKEYIKLWWKPSKMRGFIWLDNKVNYTKKEKKTLPPQRVSSNTDKFKYTNKLGLKSAIRISRIVSEMYRLRLPDVHWFVMGDDDTIFITENLVKVLSKYDHTKFYYIGSNSESHMQNLAFSYNMAYGGGGFAISYPLAKALLSMQDDCLQRYPTLFGSDDRIHACMAELGVPLSKEPGFHQYDIRGNAFGFMAAHPLAPVISLHHMDALDPVFPNKTKLAALKHLRKSMEEHPTYFLQQSICYDKERKWSISISWGFAVQIFHGIISPRDLEMPSRTFYSWNKRVEYKTFSFNSRALTHKSCQKPLIFYMHNISTSIDQFDLVESDYIRDNSTVTICKWRMVSPSSIHHVKVLTRKDESMWKKVARRKCCEVAPSASATTTTMGINVRDCYAGEIAAA